MLIIAFFCLLGAIGTAVSVYSALDLVKMSRTLYRVRKRREISIIETIQEIQKKLKALENADNDNQRTIEALKRAAEVLKNLY